jgi:hypothetical protein
MLRAAQYRLLVETKIMSGQRRNRRKARTVTDHAMAALHKYYLRAVHMRDGFYAATKQLASKYGKEALKPGSHSTERFQAEMYLDHWYAGIFAAMEGYEKLGLSNTEVERLRADPLYSKLRAYRAGTYHFREKYFDDDIRCFLAEKQSASWLVNLDTALGTFLLAEVRKRTEAHKAKPPPSPG